MSSLCDQRILAALGALDKYPRKLVLDALKALYENNIYKSLDEETLLENMKSVMDAVEDPPLDQGHSAFSLEKWKIARVFDALERDWVMVDPL